jgi:hypothetical protein
MVCGLRPHRGTNYPGRDSSWFLSVPSEECYHITLKQVAVTASSFSLLPLYALIYTVRMVTYVNYWWYNVVIYFCVWFPLVKNMAKLILSEWNGTESSLRSYSHSGSQGNSLLWNPKIHYRIHKSPPLETILSQMNPIHIFSPYFSNIHSNMILLRTPRSSKKSPSFRFPNQNCVRISTKKRYWTIVVRFGGVGGFNSRQGLGIFFFSTASRPALEPIQPPIQWVLGALSPEVKRPGREADHSSPSSTEVKECVALHLRPQYVFMAWCLVKQRKNPIQNVTCLASSSDSTPWKP